MPAKTYQAIQLDDQDAPGKKIGSVAINAGTLSIVSVVDEADRASLQKSLDDLNNRPFLVEKAPPQSGERYEIGAKEFQRGEPGFDEVLIRKLASSHSIRLEPAK